MALSLFTIFGLIKIMAVINGLVVKFWLPISSLDNSWSTNVRTQLSVNKIVKIYIVIDSSKLHPETNFSYESIYRAYMYLLYYVNVPSFFLVF